MKEKNRQDFRFGFGCEQKVLNFTVDGLNTKTKQLKSSMGVYFTDVLMANVSTIRRNTTQQ